jgi:NADH-quinone oxidoreductase subunit H
MPLEMVLKALFILVALVFGLAPLLTFGECEEGILPGDPSGRDASAPTELVSLAQLLRPLARLGRLLTENDVVPADAKPGFHLAAAAFAVLMAFSAWAVVPFAGVYAFGGAEHSMVLANPDWGLLYILMLGMLASYAALVAGWSSQRQGTLFGGLRAATQMVSYQLPMGLVAVSIFMVHGSMGLQDMAVAQDSTFRLFGFLPLLGLGVPEFLLRFPFVWPAWGLFLQPLAAAIFMTCLLAASRRAPFDLTEGGGDSRAGYLAEYAGVRLGFFYLAELIQVLLIAALFTTLFLGGWSLPLISTADFIGQLGLVIGESASSVFCVGVHFAMFSVKVGLVVWLQVWLRGGLPRLRYVQTMDLCWKVLLPLSLVNIFATAAWLLSIGGEA